MYSMFTVLKNKARVIRETYMYMYKRYDISIKSSDKVGLSWRHGDLLQNEYESKNGSEFGKCEFSIYTFGSVT